ncbi:hypothetical protein [Paenibacillus cellulositrophicus]|uniref:hypothetical protein n=1 Tax=Paenibacillus cellulositrophicus TaxID=562959 RepID=UPI003D95BFB3
MKWWKLILVVLIWIVSFMAIRSGLAMKREKSKGSVTDVMNVWPLADTISGNIAAIICSFIAGLIYKHFPWWLRKTVLHLISAILFCLGLYILITA